MPKVFHTSKDHLELLRDSKLDTILGVDESTPFLVEVAFLNSWNRDLNDEPNKYGLLECDAEEEADGPTAYFTYGEDEDEPDSNDRVVMVYAPDSANPGRYGLQIFRNDGLVYERTADQDEKTQWNINCMAGDPEVTDRDGHMLFVGDHTNI